MITHGVWNDLSAEKSNIQADSKLTSRKAPPPPPPPPPLSLSPSLCLCLSVCLSLSVSLFPSLSVCLCLYLSLLVSVCLFVCLSVSVCLLIVKYRLTRFISECFVRSVCISAEVLPDKYFCWCGETHKL